MIPEHYKLYLQCRGSSYEGKVARFTKAWFFGPVLTRTQRLQPEDSMKLDFTRQNWDTPIFLPQNYYIAELKWRGVVYSDKWIELQDATIEHDAVGTLRDLSNEEFTILIDCQKHEEHLHHKHLVYPSWVLNHEFEIIGGDEYVG